MKQVPLPTKVRHDALLVQHQIPKKLFPKMHMLEYHVCRDRQVLTMLSTYGIEA